MRTFVSLAFAALIGVALTAPDAVAAPVKKVAKKAKGKKAAGKLESKDIVKWYKAGLSEEEIVAKATAASYVPTALGISRLQKARIPSSLISALKNVAPPAAAAAGEPEGEVAAAPAAPAPAPVKASKKAEVAEKPAKKIDLKKITREEDIDFDSVPPPSGMPKWVGEEEKAREAKAAPQPDRSLRPSAPFDENAAPGKAATPPPAAGKRRVVVANAGE